MLVLALSLTQLFYYVTKLVLQKAVSKCLTVKTGTLCPAVGYWEVAFSLGALLSALQRLG